MPSPPSSPLPSATPHPRTPSHHSSRPSLSSLTCPSLKLVTPDGRAKVNTLPPWAKGFEDDDLLFQSPVSCPSPARGPTPSQSRPSPSFSSHSLLLDPRPPCVSSTSLLHPPGFSIHPPDYHSAPAKRHKSSQSHRRERAVSLDGSMEHVQLGRIAKRFARCQSYTALRNAVPTPDPNSAVPISPKRPFYLTVSPTPVLQRFRPHSSSNGDKRQATGHEARVQRKDSHLAGQIGPLSAPLPGRAAHLRHHPDDRWWQFTLPTKYRKKVEEYMHRGGSGEPHFFSKHSRAHPSSAHDALASPNMDMSEIGADERRIIDLLKRNMFHLPAPRPAIDKNSLTPRSPSLDPGSWQQIWSSSMPDHSFHPPAHHPPLDFPLSAFSRKLSLTHPQRQQLLQPHTCDGQSTPPDLLRSFTEQSLKSYKPATGPQSHSGLEKLIYYLLHHPMAPLACRLFNFSLSSISLAICAKIRAIERRLHESRILGSSTLFILVVAPFSMMHNLFAIYCEYFGAPIGIWSVSWKMFHTLSELVFISIWSAGLALGFDDELTSGLRCSGSSGRFQNSDNQKNQIDQPLQNELCRLQVSLVVMIFLGLVLYTVVLIVSLFRIFNKVSRKY